MEYQKFSFLYEFLVSFDKLSETSLPPYSALFSMLRDKKTLDAEYSNFVNRRKNQTETKNNNDGQENKRW